MIILKFGGSSVGNVDRINQVINIIEHHYILKRKRIAIVFSAFQNVTDKLIEVGNLSYDRKPNHKEQFNSLYQDHIDIANGLNPSKNVVVIEKLNLLFTELEEILHGIYLVKELTPRTLDYILSFGERFSNTIISETMNNRGLICEYLDASKLIKTNSDFGNARVDFKITDKKISRFFKRKNKTQIITGFIGSSRSNEITTLGRGGSDYTASIFGAAINAKAIEIWTDVDGILTADPRKVKNSFPLKSVSYEEAMELSHFGAKVIYPPTMLPALQKNIKIVIKNTFRPDFEGTEIVARNLKDPFTIKGISSIDDVSIVRVQGGGMIGVTGIASRLFGVLAKNRINIILISQASSEHSICLAVLPESGKDAKKVIEEEFRLEMIDKKIGEVIVEENLSIIAVVGENMRHTPGISGKVFQSLGKNNINIIAIAQGSSELNISLVINKKDLSKALNVIHKNLLQSKRK
ncbi:MAG: aspartate kinase [Bacteroidetes bacterium]|nr:aspartate kinase [Bacteroidota bacterium]